MATLVGVTIYLIPLATYRLRAQGTFTCDSCINKNESLVKLLIYVAIATYVLHNHPFSSTGEERQTIVFQVATNTLTHHPHGTIAEVKFIEGGIESDDSLQFQSAWIPSYGCLYNMIKDYPWQGSLLFVAMYHVPRAKATDHVYGGARWTSVSLHSICSIFAHFPWFPWSTCSTIFPRGSLYSTQSMVEISSYLSRLVLTVRPGIPSSPGVPGCPYENHFKNYGCSKKNQKIHGLATTLFLSAGQLAKYQIHCLQAFPFFLALHSLQVCLHVQGVPAPQEIPYAHSPQAVLFVQVGPV